MLQRNTSIGLATIFFFLFSFQGFASHFMGGQITYNCLGVNAGNPSVYDYELTLKLYRDCGGCDPSIVNCQGWGDPSSAFPFTILDITPSVLGATSVQMFRLDNQTLDVTLLCSPTEESKCDNPSKPFGVQQWIFKGLIQIPIGGGPYTFSHSALARNAAITTINNPAGTSWYIETVLDPTNCNSSPEFLNPPISLVCEHLSYTYNHNAYDVDGDSLVYSLTPCMENAFTTVNYKSPYSGGNPISSSTGITIDPINGDIIFTPDTIQVAIMAIKVEEYRNGVKLGEVMRDIQIQVVSCNNQIPAIQPLSNSGKKDTTIYPGKNFCITFKATDQDFSDTSKNLITMSITSGIIPPATWSNPSPKNILNTGTLCWTPECSDIRSQPYLVTVLAQDNACPVPGITVSTFEIYVDPPVATPPELLCVSVLATNKDIQLTWKIPDDTMQVDRYRIYRAINTTTSFVLYDSITDLAQFSYVDNNSLLNTADSIYYYFLTGFTYCNDESISSDTIASIRLQSTFVNPYLTLTWNAPTNVYTPLYRDMRKNGASFNLYDTTSFLIYVDTTDSCTPMFLEHKIDVFHPTGICISSSNIVFDTVPGKAIPDSPLICKVEVNIDNTVSIYSSADSIGIDTIIIHRLNDFTQIYDKIGTVTNMSTQLFVDGGVDASLKSYSYAITVIDTCGLQSVLSIAHTTMNLEVTPGQFTNYLEWNQYIGWDTLPDHYDIYRGTSLPLSYLAATNDTFYVDSPLACSVNFIYRIEAIKAGAGFCDSVLSDTSSGMPFDTIIPDIPVFCGVTVLGNYTDVEISYYNSISVDADSTYLWAMNPTMQLMSDEGASQNLKTFIDSIAIIPTDQQGCYFLYSLDSCGNLSVLSDTFCTIDLTAIAGNQVTMLNWTRYRIWPPDYYIVYRLYDSIWDSIGISKSLNFIDSMLPQVCNYNYVYQVKAVDTSLTLCYFSFSDTSHAEPFDGDPPVFPEFCNISVQENIKDILIDFENSLSGDAVKYELYKEGLGSPVAILGRDTISYLDENIIDALIQSGCYYLIAIDSCGNKSMPSDTFCSIDVTVASGYRKNFVVWNQFTVWKPDYYNIYAGESLPLILIDSTSDTAFLHIGITCIENLIYQIEAIRYDTVKCVSSFSDTGTVLCSDIIFPNVFTPNGDGFNEVFQPIIATNVISMDVSFYNRWGQKVNQLSDPHIMWKGRDFQGRQLASSTYYYIADVGLLQNNGLLKLTITGWVQILKD